MIKYGLMLGLIALSSISIAGIPNNLLSIALALRPIAAASVAPQMIARAYSRSADSDQNSTTHKNLGKERKHRVYAGKYYNQYFNDLNKKERALHGALKVLDHQYQTAGKTDDDEFDIQKYQSERTVILNQIKKIKEERDLALHD